MTIPIPLKDVYQISSNGNVEAIEKWHECIVLPQILLTLEDFCIAEGINDFAAFSTACHALPDLSSVIAFMPINDPQVSLPVVKIH